MKKLKFKKKIILMICFFIVTITFYIFTKYNIFSLDLKTILLEEYLVHKNYVDRHPVLFAFIYFIFSIFWIFFLGIISPVLILAILAFGYYGYILSVISFTIGGTFSYLFARKFNHLIKKKIKNIEVRQNSFLLFIVFRFIPGVPFMIKNFSGIFFDLNLKKFILATLIAETPQLFLFTYIMMTFIESSEFLMEDFNPSALLQKLLVPLLLLFLLVIFLLILKKKFAKLFFNNLNS